MRMMHAVLVGLCSVGITGCVSSVNPYIAEQSAQFEPALLGTWTDSAATERAVITQAGPQRYRVDYTDDNSKTTRFTGRLGRVGGVLLLDLESTAPKSPDDSSGAHLAVVLSTIAPRLSFAVLDPDSLKAFLRAHPRAVAHRPTKDELVFTATTDELATFLATYLRRPGVLGEPAVWMRHAP